MRRTSTLSRTSLTTPQIPTFVERTDLPRIMVKAKGGMVRYAAYVNGYIRGPVCRYKGITCVPIYYLSLVDMSGDGGKLQGIWSALVSEPPQDVYLETVGTVVLAHRDPQFEKLGYSIHWNYEQASTNDRDTYLHGIIESNMLTKFDPIAGAAPARRERKQKKKVHHAKKQKRKARSQNKIMLSTATTKELGELEERNNREKHPIFMLMVPGSVLPTREQEEPDEVYNHRREQEIQHFLAELHFAFLDLRIPQPVSIEWADFLWQRAEKTRENTKLTVWFKDVLQRKEEEQEEEEEDREKLQRTSMPVFCEAWLCRPNIVLLDADRRKARREGRISDLRELEAPVSVDASTPVDEPDAVPV
jgi:hypothetical protein